MRLVIRKLACIKGVFSGVLKVPITVRSIKIPRRLSPLTPIRSLKDILNLGYDEYVINRDVYAIIDSGASESWISPSVLDPQVRSKVYSYGIPSKVLTASGECESRLVFAEIELRTTRGPFYITIPTIVIETPRICDVGLSLFALKELSDKILINLKTNALCWELRG